MASLPSISSLIPRDLRAFLDRVREALDSSGADRLVTARELANAGLARISAGGSLEEPLPEYCGPPPAPSSFVTFGSMTSVILEWSGIAYPCHAYTEVWRADVDDISLAVLVGMSSGFMYADAVGSSASKFYWIRFINNQDAIGPFNAAAGTPGATSPDPEYLIDQLTGDGPYQPLILVTEPFELNGVLVPAGTYIRDAWIANGSIGNAKIGNAAIDSAKIADASIVNAKISDGAITTAKIGTAQIKTANIDLAAITTALIQNAAITTALIRDAAIVGAKISDASISTAKIDVGAITTALIANAAIDEAKIQDGSISNAKIRNAAITTAKIANATISSALIIDGAIISAKIQDGSIGSAKIVNGSITNAKIANAAINTAKIAVGAITTALIGTAQITGAKIANASIGSALIQDASVGTLKIAGNAVTIPVGASSGGAINFVGWTTVIQASINSTGAPILIVASCGISRFGGSIAGEENVSFRLLENGSSVASGTINGGGWTGVVRRQPGAGTRTYALQVSTKFSGFSANGRGIILLEAKR